MAAPGLLRRLRPWLFPVGFPVLLSGCVATLPPAPASRILSRERTVAIRLLSTPPVRVFADGEAAPGAALGLTPAVIAEVVIVKEVWKQGGAMAAPEAGQPALARIEGGGGEGTTTTAGSAYRYVVWIATGDEEPSRIEVEVPLLALEDGYRRGRIDIDLGDRPSARPRERS